MSTVIDALRARIREVEGHVGTARGTLVSGWSALDARVGGLPSPGLVEVVGALGSGRTRLGLVWAAAATRRGEAVAWVDPAGGPHAPVAEGLGVVLERLLVVRPDVERVAWAAEEAARSGCFSLVLVELDDAASLDGRRWEAATREGRCTLVRLGERPSPALPAGLRLDLADGRARIHRRRGPGEAIVLALPPWPPGLDPWEDAR